MQIPRDPVIFCLSFFKLISDALFPISHALFLDKIKKPLPRIVYALNKPIRITLVKTKQKSLLAFFQYVIRS